MLQSRMAPELSAPPSLSDTGFLEAASCNTTNAVRNFFCPPDRKTDRRGGFFANYQPIFAYVPVQPSRPPQVRRSIRSATKNRTSKAALKASGMPTGTHKEVRTRSSPRPSTPPDENLPSRTESSTNQRKRDFLHTEGQFPNNREYDFLWAAGDLLRRKLDCDFFSAVEYLENEPATRVVLRHLTKGSLRETVKMETPASGLGSYNSRGRVLDRRSRRSGRPAEGKRRRRA